MPTPGVDASEVVPGRIKGDPVLICSRGDAFRRMGWVSDAALAEDVRSGMLDMAREKPPVPQEKSRMGLLGESPSRFRFTAVNFLV